MPLQSLEEELTPQVGGGITSHQRQLIHIKQHRVNLCWCFLQTSKLEKAATPSKGSSRGRRCFLQTSKLEKAATPSKGSSRGRRRDFRLLEVRKKPISQVTNGSSFISNNSRGVNLYRRFLQTSKLEKAATPLEGSSRGRRRSTCY
ncbi:hypothetical protein NL676_015726 [Syzygium grande]|nr:hypothetical protein NL676_015726 [Syzygium grande]